MRRALRRLWIERAPRLFLRWCEPDRDELGRLGEELAARALARLGWRITGRRLSTPFAEIDIVAESGPAPGGVLVCVEVKSGRRPALPRIAGKPAFCAMALRWRPGLRLERRRLERQRRAGRWLAVRRGRAPESGGRVDLVEVWIARASVEIRHHGDLDAPLGSAHAPTGKNLPA